LSARLGRMWGLGPAEEPAPAPGTVRPPGTGPAPEEDSCGPGVGPAGGAGAGRDLAAGGFERLARIVAAETGVPAERLTPGRDLFELGATSRQLLRIAARIAADGGREPSLEDLFTAADLGALAEAAYPAHPPATV
ncbi:acyl carrier protein, partial [Streptomyces althioticus]